MKIFIAKKYSNYFYEIIKCQAVWRIKKEPSKKKCKVRNTLHKYKI